MSNMMTENRRRRQLADLESWRPRRDGESLIEWARRIAAEQSNDSNEGGTNA